MSLVGNLEDLGLGEILQIVSLSRKSGILTLKSGNREGRIIFLEGQVTRATTSSSKLNLGDLLVKRGLVDIETLKKALFIQRNSDNPPRIGDILAEKFGVAKEQIDEAAKEQIEKTVYGFFAWNEGTFSFELGEPGDLAAGNVNPLQFMLDQGLNPQWLAMEGSRILDEKMHRGEAVEDEEEEESIVDIAELLGEEIEDEFAAPPVSERLDEAMAEPRSGSDAPAVTGPPVFIVDDDQLTAQVVARQIRDCGYEVNVYTAAKEFLRAVAASTKEGGEPVLLVDLVMPKSDGTGILGGVEVIKKAREHFPELLLLIMTDHPTEEIEKKLASFKLPAIIPKPRKSDLASDAGKQMLADLATTVSSFVTGQQAAPAAAASQPALASAPDPDPEATYNFGEELLKEVDATDLQATPGKIQPTPGIHLLGGMLQELNNPSLGGGIILLVLRFASELMNRAVIFFVKGDDIVGLGQFGIGKKGSSSDELVREIKIPASGQSVFSEAMADFSPKHMQASDSEWDTYLLEKLGGGVPADIFIGPIISEGKVVALIYGDNLPESRPVGDTETFEIFLSQAGMAMERALQERRVKDGQAV